MNSGSNILRFPNAPRPASLPMYSLPELEGTITKWWHGVAHHMREAGVANIPDVLTIPDDRIQHWLDPDLLFSQTCGYPLTHILADKVTVIATPIYDAPGCEGADYSSMVIIPENLNVNNLSDLAGLDVAINGWDSHSGFNIFRAMVAEVAEPGERFFLRTLVTDSHARSIAAVRNKEAQCAAVDAVTLAMIGKHQPESLDGIRVLCQSPMAPGLPYITSRKVSDEELQKLQTGLFAALADSDLVPLAEDLLIKGATLAGPEDYQRIIDIETAGASVIF